MGRIIKTGNELSNNRAGGTGRHCPSSAGALKPVTTGGVMCVDNYMTQDEPMPRRNKNDYNDLDELKDEEERYERREK